MNDECRSVLSHLNQPDLEFAGSSKFFSTQVPWHCNCSYAIVPVLVTASAKDDEPPLADMPVAVNEALRSSSQLYIGL